MTSSSKTTQITNVLKLEIKNITKQFDHNGYNLVSLDGVSFSVNSGDFICLVGPSGCGKSTLLSIISGLQKASSGEIFLDGHQISHPGPERILVFQEGALFPWLTVIENIEFGLKMAGISKKERRDISKRYLDMMNLSKFEDSYPFQLSTGMKQRIAIARGLAMDPDILLMDEPFAALDSQTRDILLVELQKIWEKTKKTIIFVTHNIAEATVLGNRVLVLSNRPSKIKKEITMYYQRPRHMEDENLRKFQREIFGELRGEVNAFGDMA
jgi:NitT/TauT family transport system ATP-binding protein